MKMKALAVLLAAAAVLTVGCGRDASQSRWWNDGGGYASGGSGDDYGGDYIENLLGSWMDAPVSELFREWGPPHYDTVRNGVREVGYDDPYGEWGFFVDRRGIIYDGYFYEYWP